MLTDPEGFRHIVEVNPPELPNMSHMLLEGAWSSVLVTDNVFGKIRVSPYAFAARITHDAGPQHPRYRVGGEGGARERRQVVPGGGR